MIEGFKIKQSLFRRKYKSKQFLIEDYSIIVSKLPANTTIHSVGEKLREMLEKSECSPEEKLVVKMYFLFNISEYIALYE
jgi:hypothetical protein